MNFLLFVYLNESYILINIDTKLKVIQGHFKVIRNKIYEKIEEK